MFHGKWIKNVSAGGNGQRNEPKYWTNPQYTFTINESDIIKDTKCCVIIGLMQKYTRQKRSTLNTESTEEYIQFRLYKVRNLSALQECTRTGEPIESSDLERVGSSGSYTNKREVNARFSLSTGVYVIVPSCYDEDVPGDFLIRIFTEQPLAKK
jgi:calpain